MSATSSAYARASVPSVVQGGPIRIGYIPLLDSAPLFVARAEGFFKKQGLEVVLSREVGWATVRDKLIYRQLDASHAVAPLPIAATLGLGCLAIPCLTAFVLNAHGDSITLSTALWKRGVRDAVTLREEILRIRHERQLVFGVVFGCSSQNILLRDWLRAGGIDPARDVRIVVVPPPQLHRNLAAGTLDGYCVGDPWNSLAVREKTGWIAATSADIAPGHPEKVLAVREDFAVNRSGEHLALVAALHHAAVLCDDPGYRPELVKLLARPENLGLPARVLTPALVGPFARGGDFDPLPATDIIRFHAHSANIPSPARAQWILDGLSRHGLLPRDLTPKVDLARRVFRSDLHAQALARRQSVASAD